MSSFPIIFSFPKILEKINLRDCCKTRALKFSKIRVARAKMMMSNLNNNVCQEKIQPVFSLTLYRNTHFKLRLNIPKPDADRNNFFENKSSPKIAIYDIPYFLPLFKKIISSFLRNYIEQMSKRATKEYNGISVKSTSFGIPPSYIAQAKSCFACVRKLDADNRQI